MMSKWYHPFLSRTFPEHCTLLDYLLKRNKFTQEQILDNENKEPDKEWTDYTRMVKTTLVVVVTKDPNRCFTGSIGPLEPQRDMNSLLMQVIVKDLKPGHPKTVLSQGYQSISPNTSGDG